MNALSVRARLVRDTRPQHDLLHRHPLLGQLTGGDLKASGYRTALTVFMILFHGVEQARARGPWWPEYSLQVVLDALSRDLENAVAPDLGIEFSSKQKALGALYVAHGSSFGRHAMRKPVQSALPAASHCFLMSQLPVQSWRRLCDDLEILGQSHSDYLKTLSGASCVFDLMTCLLTDPSGYPLENT